MTNSCTPDNLGRMDREISAGGVVVRSGDDGWQIAVIEPQREAAASASATAGKRKISQKKILALPKGLIDPGEKPEQTAIREVAEETGLTAVPITRLGDIKYVYVRSWGDQQRVFKIVSFYLLRYQSGKIDQIAPEMRIEVKQALWIPLEGAVRALAYKGEKEVVRKAQEYLKAHPEGICHAS
jgi:8-oxo-dGTP pyrophosphatase MutT (NUDIX family)